MTDQQKALISERDRQKEIRTMAENRAIRIAKEIADLQADMAIQQRIQRGAIDRQTEIEAELLKVHGLETWQYRNGVAVD